jgi:ankyrin repeat protein
LNFVFTWKKTLILTGSLLLAAIVSTLLDMPASFGVPIMLGVVYYLANFDGKKSTAKNTTILIVAVDEGDLEKVKAIIAKNIVGLDDQDFEGYTALHHATVKMRLDIVDALLSAGANRTLATKRGETALQIAERAKWSTGASRLELVP